MDLQFNMEIPQRSTYSELVIISSDEESTFSDGVSMDSSQFEEDMMDMETQMMVMRVEEEMTVPVNAQGRQMTTGYYDPDAPSTSAEYYLSPMAPHEPIPENHYEIQKDVERRRRKKHPISMCSNLIPFVDTPLSPPTPERGFMEDEEDQPETPMVTPNQSPPATNFPVVTSIGHVGQVPHCPQPNNATLPGTFTDCMVCGKSYEQITDELVIDFIHRTEYLGESAISKERRRLAFLEGMRAGTFLLVPRGVSQAAACDGNVYAIPQSAVITRALPNTLPLL